MYKRRSLTKASPFYNVNLKRGALYMSFVLEEATITTIHNAFKAGELTCQQLVEDYLKRIEKYDEELKSIILINPNVIQEAKELDELYKKEGISGSLHGIPVLLKDNVETKDMPTTGGSLSLEGWHSERDAFLVKKLREAGAIIIAKTNLHEFAVWGETVSSILGQSYNPYDYTRTPGGSSGGTGASVAANFGVIGIGTDTINSIRSPASACSLAGIRPTVGLVSRGGVIPYSLTQDTSGPITRTIEDSVRTLDIIKGIDPADEITETQKDKAPASYMEHLKKDGLKGKRIGVVKGFIGKEENHQPVNKVFYKAIEELKEGGAEIIDIDDEFNASKLVNEVSVHLHDLKTHLNEYLASFGDKIPVNSIEEILESGKYVKNIEENFKEALGYELFTKDYTTRLLKRDALQENVVDILATNRLDALVYPHQQQLVCKAGASQDGRNGVLGSVTGFPAITVPAGFSQPDENAPIGVPIGIEFLGEPFCEGKLIEIAYGYEQNYPKRKKPILKED